MYGEIKRELDKMSSMSGEDFRRLRKLIGVTQSQFASLLDVDVKTVSRIERGYCRISARMAFALHFVYGVYRSIHTEHQIQEFEKKERERQQMLRESEAAAAAEPRQPGGCKSWCGRI
ncbi:TPA: helix-turn-helix transcriptional regulator [Escherichia coli]|nr:helix-turn-helix transcriptional regulator [Escherichia coli]HDV2690422.1 helix-turn-helix transcriptional regulator [Escherichia coli]